MRSRCYGCGNAISAPQSNYNSNQNLTSFMIKSPLENTVIVLIVTSIWLKRANLIFTIVCFHWVILSVHCLIINLLWWHHNSNPLRELKSLAKTAWSSISNGSRRLTWNVVYGYLRCAIQIRVTVNNALPNTACVKPSSIASLDLSTENSLFFLISVSLSRLLILLHCLSVPVYGG